MTCDAGGVPVPVTLPRSALAAIDDEAVPPVRVLVVDDSPVQRRFLRAALEADPNFVVSGEAATGEDAVELVRRLGPAAVLMDLDLPGMDGLTAIEKIMAEAPTPVVVYSAHVPEGSPNAKAAMAAGAVRVLCKPGPDNALSLDDLSDILREQVRTASRATVIRHLRGRLAAGLPGMAPARPRLQLPSRNGQPLDAGHAPLRRVRAAGRPLVVIGASTGGPPALAAILSALPDKLAAPVLVVQHMADGFIEGLAAWLNRVCAFDVSIASDGQRLRAGMVALAPTTCDVVVEPGLVLRCREPLPGQLNVPSVDVTFESVAASVGPAAVGVVLTGMGRDGALGSRVLHDRGAVLLGQDKGSCVVFGMPAAAEAAGALDRLVPLDDIAPSIIELVGCRP